MKGKVKKKRNQSSLISKLDSSVVRYFRLWCNGKFLCYYDEDPVSPLRLKQPKDVTKPPKGVTFITEIIEVMPSYKGKKSHFFLKLKGQGKDLHLKCDDYKQSNLWVESLTGLSDYYRGKRIVDWIDERKDYKSEIDVRVTIMIMIEQESKLHPNLQRAAMGLHPEEFGGRRHTE